MIKDACRIGRLLTLGAVLSVPVAGSAQDADVYEASGVVAGNFHIRPSLRLSLGYDTNTFYNADSRAEPRNDSAVLLINPNIGFSVPYVRFVDLDAQIGFSWTENFGDDDTASLSRGLGIGSGFSLNLNPRGAISVRLSENIRMSNESADTQEGNEDVFQVAYDDAGFDFAGETHLTNRASLGLHFHPGGDADDNRMGFSGNLTGTHTFRHYLERTELRRHIVGGNLRLNWNFLPRTGAFFTAGVNRTFYPENTRSLVATRDPDATISDDNPAASPVVQNESVAARFTVGVRGLITPRLSSTVRVGWGLGWYDGAANPSQFLAAVQLTGHLGKGHSIRGGYGTNFADASFGNYVTYHRLSLAYELDKGRVGFNLSAFGQINDYADYDAVTFADNGAPIEIYSPSRVDYPVGAVAQLSFALSRNIRIGARYRVDMNFTDFRANLAPAPDLQLDYGDPSYVKHRIFFFVRFAI